MLTIAHNTYRTALALLLIAGITAFGYVIIRAHAASPVVGDLNNDGIVNVLDLSQLLSKWGTNDGTADLNGDGTVNVFDLSTLLAHWQQTASSSPTSTPTVTPTPSTSPSPSPTPTGAVSGVPAGISPGSGFENTFLAESASQQAADIALMKAKGVKYLRVDVACNYTNLAEITDAQNAGIQVDALLLDPCAGQTAADYAAWATQEVAQLKPLGVKIYEVMNEPNGCEYSLTASAYTAILKATYTAVKAADPSAFVLMAGLCPPDDTADLPYNYLTAMYAAGAKGYFDAANDHPYSFPDTPLQTSDGWNPWSYLTQMHTIMANNGDGNKQIWLTEFGCPTGTDAGQPADCTPTTEGQQITDAFSSARAWSWAGPLLIFSWQDTTTDGDFGLYDKTGAAKTPALNAFTSAAGQ